MTSLRWICASPLVLVFLLTPARAETASANQRFALRPNPSSRDEILSRLPARAARRHSKTSSSVPSIPLAPGLRWSGTTVRAGIGAPAESPTANERGFSRVPGSGELFLAAPSYETGGIPAQATAIGDINSDGHADVVVADACLTADNCSTGGVSVFLGTGNGTFGNPVNYSSGGTDTYSATLADLNHDGKLDLVVANRTCNTNVNDGCIAVLLGNGNGTFQTATSYASGGYFALSVATADLNNDGNPDVIVVNEQAYSNDLTGGVSVLLGMGDGTLMAAVSYSSAGYNASSVAAGDFNHDGKVDVAVTNLCVDSNNCLSGSISVLPGNGNGTLQSGTSFGSGGYDPSSMAIVAGDLNGDGSLDLVAAHECVNSDDCSTGSVSVLLGHGNGSFQPATNYASTGASIAVVAGDIDEDGKVDLAVANEQGDSSGTVAVLFGNGDGTLQYPVSYASGGYYPTSLALADLSGDGRPDLVTTVQPEINFNSFGMVTVLKGGWQGKLRAALSYVGNGPASIVTGDFNQDGKSDLAETRFCGHPCTNGELDIQLGNGDGSFQPPVTYSSGGYFPFEVQKGDFNRDGKTDLVVVNDCADQSCTNGSVGVLLGNGDGTFQAAVSYSVGQPGGFSVAVGDFNRDGNLDLAVSACNGQDCSDGLISILLGHGDGTFGSPSFYAAGGAASSLATDDLNADGWLDLVVANPCRCPFGDNVSILLGSGNGTFQPPLSYATGGIVPDDVKIADVNDDGKLDLITANQCHDNACASGGVVGVLLGNGDGTFQTAVSYSSWEGWSNAVQIGDFNGDGAADIAVENMGTDHAIRARSTVLLMGNGDGTFQVGDTYLIGGWSSTIGDFNRDGKPDLAVGDRGSVTILRDIAAGYRFATSVDLRSSANPAEYGQPLTFTATVTPSHAGTLSGSVTFYDGATALATLGLSGKRAKFTTSNLGTGAHAITAAYSGNNKFLASTSKVLNQIVYQTNSHTTIASSLNPITYNQPVTFTATVISKGGAPQDGEQVTFKDGGSTLGSVPLHSGVASYIASSLAAGTHNIKAIYAGDANIKPSSGKLSQTVNQARSISKLVSLLNPSQLGEEVKFRVRVLGEYGGLPTGKVTFKDGTKILATVALNHEGLAFCTTSKLTRGEHRIHTAYTGDNNFAASHALVIQTVQ